MLCSKILQNIKPQVSLARWYSSSQSCKVLVLGGGTGGCTIAAKLSKQFKKNDICILEPADRHYYQPMFTLIGAGVKKLPQSYRLMKDVLPKEAKWIKESAASFDPKSNTVTTDKGTIIKYDYLIISLGINPHFEKIPGLSEALKIPNGEVSTIFDAEYTERTFKTFENFKEGNAVFTFPHSQVKCPGAPQKIMYLCEDYLRKNGKRDRANVIYNTNLPVLFGVKAYSDTLWKVVKSRDIKVNLKTNLVEIKPDKKEAVFESHDNDNKIVDKSTVNYSLLHVTPPMSPPESLRTNKELTDKAGYLNVDKHTMQHVTYKNIFGLGDCTNTPNSKTGAAAAVQSGVVYHNFMAYVNGKDLKSSYDGYGSCPLVTSYGKCILAEFGYDGVLLETFPFGIQNQELWTSYFMKKDLLPQLYFKLMLNGYWSGPTFMRNLMHLRLSKLF